MAKSIKNNINKERKIIEKDGKRLLIVSSLEDLKIISSPQRQRILKLMDSASKPLHGKEIADKIGIKAPSAHFHLRKLKEIGAVRISHTQSINGITATYYEPAVDDIIMGEDILTSSDDEEINNKLLLAANFFNEAKTSFTRALGKNLQDNNQSTDSDTITMLLNRLLYLSVEDTDKFVEEIDTLLNKYTDFSSNKQPYSIFLSVSETENI